MGSTKAAAFVVPDPFIGTGNNVADYIPNWHETTDSSLTTAKDKAKQMRTNLSDVTHVSRPVNGIRVKPNTHAFVQVINSSGQVQAVFNQLGQFSNNAPRHSGDNGLEGLGKEAPADILKRVGQGRGGPAAERDRNLADGANITGQDQDGSVDKQGNPTATAWTDWILQSVQEQRVEKVQVVETFGDNYLYAFGEKPRSLSFQGLLVNTLDYNWRAIFWANWDAYFRATRLVESNCRMYIGFDDIIVEGYPINAVANQSAESPNAIMFSFTFFVTNYINMAENKKFATQRQQNIAIVRSGLQNALDRGSFTKLGFGDRFSLIQMLGGQGAGLSGTAAYNMISPNSTRAPGMLRDAQELTATLVGQTVSDTVRALGKGMLASIAGPANAMQFLNAFLAKQSRRATEFAWKGTLDALEGPHGMWQRGEINQWYGFTGQILEAIEIGNWSGKSGAKTDTGIPDILKHETMSRMIQSMSYSIGVPFSADDAGFSATAGSGVTLPNDKKTASKHKTAGTGIGVGYNIASDANIVYSSGGDLIAKAIIDAANAMETASG